MTPQPPPGQPPVPPGQQPPMNYPPRGPFTPPGMMPPGMLPPGMIPPPMMMMPPPAPRGGGFAKAILVTLATTLFSASLLLNLYLLVVVGISGSKANPDDVQTTEKTILDGDASQKIAVVRLDGIIDDKLDREFVALLDKVEKDKDVKAVVLEINSPGGGVTASDEMYDAVIRLKKERGLPVVVSMNSLAASGGYYVSMAGDKIFAQETTLTGSIGVILQRYDLSGLGEKYGIKDGSIIADGAWFKNAGSPLKPLSPEEETYLKSVIDDAFTIFKSRVAKGRPSLTSKEIDVAANGKVYSAQQALALKLIDKIGYLDDAIGEAAKLASLSKPKAVRVDRELSFFEQLGMGAASKIGPPSASAGVNVSISRDTINGLVQPKLMYLWSGN